MDFNKIIQRVIGIITKPKDEWNSIKSESLSLQDIFIKYAIWVAIIPSVAAFIGVTLIGIKVAWLTVKVPFGRAFISMIFNYIFTLAGVFLLGFIIDALAPSFGSEKNLESSVKVAVFSAFPAWVAGILFIIPSLSVLGSIAGLYALYVMYIGLKELKQTPDDKYMGYFIVTIVIYIIISVLIFLLVKEIGGYNIAGF